MATVDLRTPAGSTSGTVELADAVFGIEPHQAVLHQVVTAQLAAARAGTQSTLTRAEVRGGGAKPYKQKGTGRARQGSTRAPQWAGGGVALGPKPRSYRQRTPKKMIQLALRSALSDRAATDRVVVVDAWRFDTPKTQDAVAALKALGVDGRVLVVVGPDDLMASKSFRNLPDVHVLLASELNAYDVLCSDWVVFTQATLPTAPAAADAPRSDQAPVVASTAVDGGVPATEPEPVVDEAPVPDDGTPPDGEQGGVE